MLCKLIQILIDYELDGQNSSKRSNIISRHINKCPECKTYYMKTNNTESILQNSKPVIQIEQSNALAESIINNLPEKPSIIKINRIPDQYKKSHILKLHKLTAAAIMLIMISLVSLYHHRKIQQQRQIDNMIAKIQNYSRLVISEYPEQKLENLITDPIHKEANALINDTKSAIKFVLCCTYTKK